MVERGGKARALKVPDARGRTLRPIMLEGVDVKRCRLMTDGNRDYRRIKDYLPRDVIDHEIEHVRPYVHTQTIDGYWGNRKW